MHPSEKIIDYIRNLLKNYDKNVTNISDIISVLREIKEINDGKSLWFNDIFLGLGIFLENLKENELNSFIHINFRNLFYYAQIIDKVIENDLLLKCNFGRISLTKAKSILACSILCVMPQNVNLQALYAGISLGSNNHTQMLRHILTFFSEDPLRSIVHEQDSFITLTIALREAINLNIIEPLHLWPIVLTSRTQIADISLPNCQNIRPMYFSKFLPSNLFNSSNISAEFSVYSKLPVLIPLLPLFAISIFEPICFIDVKWENFHHRFQNVRQLNSWNRKSQYSKEYVLDNLTQCVYTLKLLNDLSNASFASSFTKSVIEDVIEKLHFKSSPITFSARSNSYTEPLQQSRVSISSTNNSPYIVRGSREGSLTSNIPVRSTRHSYSTSSSSRNGSLQLSSLSSRRSSSNTSSSNKDEVNVSLGDKGDCPLHIFQPIIVEESGNNVDEEEFQSGLAERIEECKSPLSAILQQELMSASICDSSKMSLSNDFQVNTEGCSLRRRNSSPIFKQIFQEDDDECSLVYKQKEFTTVRCCEEDANNDHLIRLNNRCRRQSLPCHLRWLYDLPLTDTTKLNLSNSRSVIDDGGLSFANIFEELSDDFLNCKVIGDSKDILAKLIIFADEILNEICLNERRDDQQQLLKMDILERKRVLEESCSNDEVILSGEDHSLLSRDLATFDKVLYSSTFFDNEALNIFSKISTMSSSSYTWTPRENVYFGVEETLIDKVHDQSCQSHNQCNEKSIVEYVDQLTTSIMFDVMDHDFGASRINTFCERSILNLAERMSMEIITDSLTHLCDQRNKSFDTLSLIYVRPFPGEYDRQLSTLIQMVAASIAQQESGRTHLLVFNQVTVEVEEILNLLVQEKTRFSAEKVFRAMINIVNETGTISISNLILHLMHNY